MKVGSPDDDGGRGKVCLVDVVVGVRVVDLKLVRVSAYYNPDIWRPAWRQGSRISTGIDDQPPAKNEKTGKMSKQPKMSTQHGTKNEKADGKCLAVAISMFIQSIFRAVVHRFNNFGHQILLFGKKN